MENEDRRKNKFWKGVLVGALATAFAGLIVVGVAAGISVIGRSVIYNQTVSESKQIENAGDLQNAAGLVKTADDVKLNITAVEEKLATLESIINQYFLFDKEETKLEDGIYKGMMSGLDDPYSVYYTAEEYASLSEETEGIYCGIGVLVTQNIETGLVTALRVFPFSPAEEAGMKRGDILYKIEDIESSSEDLDVLVRQYIRGEAGTYVNLTVMRDGEEIPMKVERRFVEVATVEHEMLADEIGYVMVTQFDIVTGDQFKEAIDDLEKQGMKKLIIDLRDNPGGVLTSCVSMAAYMLPENQFEGTILSTGDKNGAGERYYCQGGKVHMENVGSFKTGSRYIEDDTHEVDVPTVILVNGNSASAAEVFAGAMQDYGAAKLLGTTTYGKGIVQSLLPLKDGSAVKLTVAHYYTPSGFDLHGKGLTPDIEVELELDEELKGQYDVPFDRDNQVQAAIEELKREER